MPTKKGGIKNLDTTRVMLQRIWEQIQPKREELTFVYYKSDNIDKLETKPTKMGGIDI